jgi:hypothetical protein
MVDLGQGWKKFHLFGIKSSKENRRRENRKKDE